MLVEGGYLDGVMAFEPAAAFAALRSCPVGHVANHDPAFYAVGRFDDVVAVLKQPGQWTNGAGPGVFHQEGGVLGSADDPDHARHRAVLRSSFTVKAVARYEPALVAMADELLGAMLPEGEGDFVERFAFPFPALAVGELFGVRAEDREFFRRLSHAVVAALSGGDLAAYHAARESLGDYVDARLAEREAVGEGAADPGGGADVLASLLAARRDGVLSAGEVRHLGHQLLVAGHETTTSLLGLMLYRLLQRPEAMAALRADPALIPAAVEEALRFDSPVTGLFRTNGTACSLNGVELPAKTKLQVVFGSANRDPDRFPDPDEFRLDRPAAELGQHVAFGWGIHYCIGAALARLEAKVAFERLLARTTHIELAGTPQRNRSFVLHGLESLPLRWTQA
jgi:cytochrome P450